MRTYMIQQDKQLNFAEATTSGGSGNVEQSKGTKELNGKLQNLQKELESLHVNMLKEWKKFMLKGTTQRKNWNRK